MTPRRLRSAAIACAVVVLAGGVMTGCGKRELKTGREGQGIRVGGVTYNVYITRQLNPRDAEDSAYTAGIRTDQPGYYFYGVFLTACNENDNKKLRITPTTDLAIRDTQGDKFLPLRLPRTNVFAYRVKPLAKKSCVPPAGSVAAVGPTAGALLIFKVPVIAVENRPLELEIRSRGGQSHRVELDI
jgi:hypothetical protein